MRRLLTFTIVVAVLSLGETYSKYGRSCKDIGCPSNQICVMKEDPCTVYARDECGKYPTCAKVSNAASTCETFICPPTQICRIDGGQPKCFDDPAAAGTKENKRPVQSYNPGSPFGDLPSAPVFPSNNNYPQNPNANYPQNPNTNYPQNPNPYPYNPNYPQNPNSGVYPNLPSGGLAPGQTTSRPNVYQPGQRVNGGGYQGGQVGSGYPGYPQQGGGHSGYPGQTYPGRGSYPGQGQGYPNQGYPGQGYPGQGGYPSQGGYPKQSGNYPKQGYGNQGYGNKPSGQDSSNPIVDRITDTLKTLGLFWFIVKYMISRVNGIYS